MYAPLRRPDEYTYADYLSWDTDRRYELHEGRAVMLAAPSSDHQYIAAALTGLLFHFLIGKKCNVYSAPFDVRLFQTQFDRPKDVDTVVQPDVSVICDPNKIDKAGCKGAPDFIIEILSPSTGDTDRRYKFDLYQRAGVREYWIVDPVLRCVLVHTLEDGRYHASVVYPAQATVPVSVLDGCQIDLSLVFPEK